MHYSHITYTEANIPIVFVISYIGHIDVHDYEFVLGISVLKIREIIVSMIYYIYYYPIPNGA